MSSIVQAFTTLQLKITEHTISQLERLVIAYETRGSHVLALNSQMLGIHPIVFTDADRRALFELWHTTEAHVNMVIHEAPFIDRTRKVTSDPFNLLATWLLHLAVIYIPDDKMRQRFQLNIAKYLHYRFFTSLVNHYLPYGAVESVMTAVVNSLTRKYDIIEYGSWRAAIEARSLDLISPTSIHYNTIQTASPDKEFLYILSDVQTRLRDKIGNICDVYYRYRKEGIAIGSRPATDTDLEGEQIVVAKSSVFDAAISNMTIEILNQNQFIDHAAVNSVARQFQAISSQMLTVLLAEWSALATTQTKSRELDYVKTTPDGPLYIGARALIAAIIQTSFRYAINNRISLNNKAQLWVQLKNIYSSSRTTDKDILAVKASMLYFVDSVGRTSRESTKSSLRLALIMYIVYRCFRYI